MDAASPVEVCIAGQSPLLAGRQTFDFTGNAASFAFAAALTAGHRGAHHPPAPHPS